MAYPRKSFVELLGVRAYYGICLSFAGFVFLVFVLVLSARSWAFASHPPVPALVTEVVAEQLVGFSHGNGPKRAITRPWVGLRVTVDGEVVSLGVSPERGTFDKLAVGRTVLLRYNPRNPLSSLLEDDYRGTGSTSHFVGFAFLTVLCLGGGTILFALSARQAKAIIATRDHGLERRATVLDRQRSLLPHGKPARWMFAISWRDEMGATGLSYWHMPPGYAEDVALPRAGEEIRVYVSPHNHKFSFWEGDVGSRRVGLSD